MTVDRKCGRVLPVIQPRIAWFQSKMYEKYFHSNLHFREIRFLSIYSMHAYTYLEYGRIIIDFMNMSTGFCGVCTQSTYRYIIKIFAISENWQYSYKTLNWLNWKKFGLLTRKIRMYFFGALVSNSLNAILQICRTFE